MNWWKSDISRKLYLPSGKSTSLQTNSWFTIHTRTDPQAIDLQNRNLLLLRKNTQARHVENVEICMQIWEVTSVSSVPDVK